MSLLRLPSYVAPDLKLAKGKWYPHGKHKKSAQLDCNIAAVRRPNIQFPLRLMSKCKRNSHEPPIMSSKWQLSHFLLISNWHPRGTICSVFQSGKFNIWFVQWLVREIITTHWVMNQECAVALWYCNYLLCGNQGVDHVPIWSIQSCCHLQIVMCVRNLPSRWCTQVFHRFSILFMVDSYSSALMAKITRMCVHVGCLRKHHEIWAYAWFQQSTKRTF